MAACSLGWGTEGCQTLPTGPSSTSLRSRRLTRNPSSLTAVLPLGLRVNVLTVTRQLKPGALPGSRRSPRSRSRKPSQLNVSGSNTVSHQQQSTNSQSMCVRNWCDCWSVQLCTVTAASTTSLTANTAQFRTNAALDLSLWRFTLNNARVTQRVSAGTHLLALAGGAHAAARPAGALCL